jgi:lipopolysaccharide/colanic/teichoic acid biosynthesis glycosyltransferase
MEAFLKEWYGILAFVAFDLIAIFALICITYRWFFKRIFDFFAAIFGLIVCAPIVLAAWIFAITAKKRGETQAWIKREQFVGKKGKNITLHAFYGSKAGKILRLYDLFCGRISVVGTKLFRAQDCAFLDEDEQERMLVRPGCIHPLILCGNQETDYDEMIQVEKKYAQNYSFFKDMKIFFTWLLKKIRGENDDYMGETRFHGYIETLKKEERISQEEYTAAIETLSKE